MNNNETDGTFGTEAALVLGWWFFEKSTKFPYSFCDSITGVKIVIGDNANLSSNTLTLLNTFAGEPRVAKTKYIDGQTWAYFDDPAIL